MNVMWILSIICGIITAIGVAFLIGAALLDRSNNLGDSTLSADDYSTKPIFISEKERTTKYDMGEFQRYVDMNMDIMCKSAEYQDQEKRVLKKDPNALVERFFPVAGSQEDVPEVVSDTAIAETSDAEPEMMDAPVMEEPVMEEPIYEAPTATRPLWENTSENDDFSDFEQ